MAGLGVAAVSAGPCNGSAEVLRAGRAGLQWPVYLRLRFAWAHTSLGRVGRVIMPRIVMACAALAFGIFASPSTAQQTSQAQPFASAQPAGGAESLPPETQAMPEPPPFPPMPKARPSHRWTTPDHHAASTHHRVTHARHSSSASHHRATSAHHGSTHHRVSRTHREKAHQRVVKPSARTVRFCHRLTYTKIMRNSSCRALMSQELKAAAATRHHHATHHHATHHQKASKARARHSKHHK